MNDLDLEGVAVYPGYQPELPDLVLIEAGVHSAAANLLLDRFEVQVRDGAPVPRPAAWVAGYVPPQAGWPWLIITCAKQSDGEEFNETYQIEGFWTEAAWTNHIRDLILASPDSEVRIPDRRRLN